MIGTIGYAFHSIYLAKVIGTFSFQIDLLKAWEKIEKTRSLVMRCSFDCNWKIEKRNWNDVLMWQPERHWEIDGKSSDLHMFLSVERFSHCQSAQTCKMMETTCNRGVMRKTNVYFTMHVDKTKWNKHCMQLLYLVNDDTFCTELLACADKMRRISVNHMNHRNSSGNQNKNFNKKWKRRRAFCIALTWIL